MLQGITEKLTDGLQTGFVDYNLTSLEQYHPKLLVNDHKRGVKVLSNVIEGLRGCDAFYFSVAFITNSGVASLINILKELEEKNIQGKIITSQYQNFTQPKALRRLLAFRNIELRIVTDGNFHAKGYIFKQREDYSFIIGSSNLTQNALGLNKEWNLKMSSLENGLIMQNILKEFQQTFECATVVDEAWLKTYEDLYAEIRKVQTRFAAQSGKEANLISLERINPNRMQTEALRALKVLRNDGKKKALLISATGTGKTYLSAFDAARFQPKKFLFVVHRENIARAALRSYQKILGHQLSAGILSGRDKEYEKDYIFATVQTISQEHVFKRFSREHFDYIVIDEVHRSGAASYQCLFDYFQPKFLLGMSATPERTDGYDIFKAFDYQIAYEIRLNKALEENMLSPFHYYGVSEIAVDGELIDAKADFSHLVCKERVDRILEAAQYYGWDSGRVKGLIFCSRVEEAKALSEEFNRRGFESAALSGEDSEAAREEAILRLEQNEARVEIQDEWGSRFRDKLDYIFTVDIFNEGVDIPSVNQIIMLRPTQSAIIFVQQLGRGLRRSGGKEYLTVIDFIGNYANNYLIPIALYGDRSYNKDTIRRLINNGSSLIPGSSTIDFDRITKERIYQAINTAQLSLLKDLKKEFELLKYRIGRTPCMMDFVEHGSREPFAFVEYSGSFYAFVHHVEPMMNGVLDDRIQRLLQFYSQEILNGKRIEEVILLALLLANGDAGLDDVKETIRGVFNCEASNESIHSAAWNLNGLFLQKAARRKYGITENIFWDGSRFSMSDEYMALMRQETFAYYLNDMIRYANHRFKSSYRSDTYREGFILYEKYSRKDVCRILNWDTDESGTVNGYRIKHGTCPIFVNYKKDESISASIKYKDRLLNLYQFNWMTRNRVRLDSSEVKRIMAYREDGLRIPLFIRKDEKEGAGFYFMGDMIPYEFTQEQMPVEEGRFLPSVNIKFQLEDSVEEALYLYLES